MPSSSLLLRGSARGASRRLSPCLHPARQQQPRQPTSPSLFISHPNLLQHRPFFTGLKSKLKDLVGIEKTPEEKRQAKVDESIHLLTKNMPAPFKAAMFLAKPLLSKMMSAGAQAMEDIQDVTSRAESVLSRDSSLSEVLGTPLRMSPPMFTHSAAVGNETAVVLHCAVQGSKGQGLAKISAKKGEIVSLVVEANGREFRVEMSREEDVIEASFVNKK
jgi:hypothetical protein